MQSEPVFYDPSGKRKRVTTSLAAVIGLALGIIMTLFMFSLVAIPVLPKNSVISSVTHDSDKLALPQLTPKQIKLRQYMLNKSVDALYKDISLSKSKQVVPIAFKKPSDKIVTAFYAPWQDTGLQSLRANADKITHLMPDWLHIDPSGTKLDLYDWNPSLNPRNADVVHIAREHHLQMQPILNNAEGGTFDPKRVHKLLQSEKDQVALANRTKDWLLAHNFQGINMDLENLYPDDYAKLPGFLSLFAQVMHRNDLSLSVDAEAFNANADLVRLSKPCDFVIVMAYDEHGAYSSPGPISSMQWYEQVLKTSLESIPAQKLVIGLGNYAYDWANNRAPAEALTYQAALIAAQDNNPDDPPQDIVGFEQNSLNPTFAYEDDKGRQHRVWILDATTAYNQWLIANKQNIRGAALWALGMEDPSIWSFLDKHTITHPSSPYSMRDVHFPYELEFNGQGEVLTVRSLPRAGERKIILNNNNGYIVDARYVRFPSSYVIDRSGFRKNSVALTFDDGPSAPYTAQVLGVLRDKKVPATFFVIGENAQQYPNLVQQMWDQGDEIGNHTFTHPNIGAVSEHRAILELNTTQRALESIIQRSTILFRPPYNADAEPTSGEEVRPILLASKLGYMTVGEFIDPQDWNLFEKTKKGTLAKRTPEVVAQSILQQVSAGHGNVILMHDGGGDRTLTIQALKLIIPELQKKGYRFVTVSRLLGLPRSTVMPAISSNDVMLVGFDRVIFEIIYAFETFLSIAFMVGIVLGIGRVIFYTILAAIQKRRDHPVEVDASFHPPVSALIAAYNEQPVIIRTIESILRSDYKPLEVIIVDDGSKDGTSQEVSKRFKHDARVKLICQANAGKSAALNTAIANANGEVLICLDADTQIAADAISLLVRHFADPKVASVAGNIKVGNRINVLTNWQAIEYISSQNLDRRALALLNAITVIPGAIGAWRRSAVLGVGGYVDDTLAEDMDLTWRLHRAGWLLAVDSRATAYTETPDSLRNLFKQRFRWAYGTLQCLWKHRSALLHYGWFGWLALPSLWVFQVLFQVLAPLVDFMIIYNLLNLAIAWASQVFYKQDWQPFTAAAMNLQQIGFFYALFFVVELLGAVIAFVMDKERLKPLWWLFWQRFIYRQLMYFVILRSLWMASKGIAHGWGKLERKGTVEVSETLP